MERPAEDKGSRYPRRLYVAFAAMAIAASLGLDYLASRRGERAYLFPPPQRREAAIAVRAPLPDLAGRALADCGIAARDIRRDQDEKGLPRLTVRLAKDVYLKVASALQSIFQENGASVQAEEGERAGQTTYSWSVARGESERLALLFAFPPTPAPKKEEPTPPPSPRPAAAEKIAAIVIDDMGDSLEALQKIVDLHVPLTISILPQSPYAKETAQTAHDNNLEVMLHLPGESLNHQEGNPSPAAFIRSDMGAEEIRSFVLDSLGRVPFVSGANNHMGSKITQEPAVVAPILSVLKEKGLFFLDSRTGDRSIAYDLAHEMGLRATFRNVFLDAKVGVDYSRKRLVELFKLAQKKGRAVAIGHPFPETLQALRNNLSLPRKYGVKLVFASQIIAD